MSQLKRDLIAARSLIDTPEKWTIGTFARDRDGNRVDSKDPTAFCFCMYGSLNAILPRGANPRYDAVSQALRDAMPEQPFQRDIDEFNDHPDTTHEMVLAVYDRAIEAA